MVAMTAAPMDPPMVRMLAFMPLATPVCSGGDGGDDQVGQAGEDQAHAGAHDGGGHVELPLVLWANATIAIEPAAIRQPRTTTYFGPIRRAICEEKSPTTNIVTEEGSRIRPDWVIEAPKP